MPGRTPRSPRPSGSVICATGGVEAPVMPYCQYAGMADRDVDDLVAYLRTLPPVRNANRPAETAVPMPRLAYRAWRWWFTRAERRAGRQLRAAR